MNADRLRQSIVDDFKQQGSDKDKLYSLLDKCTNQTSFSDYKEIVKLLNDDNTFPFTVKCTLLNGTIKTQYNHFEAKRFESVSTSKILKYIDALRNHVANLDETNDVSLSVYYKHVDNVNSHIIVEDMSGSKSLEIRVKNDFTKQ